jgi:EAL domain-containing protein (putative c-di-GMP-specific phosphodiesterase class I)
MNNVNAALVSSKARVLVIDDEPMMRKLLARLLQKRGYEVVTAGDGSSQRTREVIERGSFDLVITDLHMPEINGMSVLRLVRERDPDLPVILVTAAPSTESAIGAVKLRATAYLTKPIDERCFEAEVQEALALGRLSRVRREAHVLLSSKVPEENSALNAQFDSALAKVFMAFQPIVSWGARGVFGYEALVRSSEPSLPHPGALFGAAERLGRSKDLGRTIRQRTTGIGMPPGSLMFLNLHADDLLDDDLFDPSTPLAKVAHDVVLEITERAQLDGIPDNARRIGDLRKLGFRIAVDDIGAGYSGLSSFALLKPDIVKLDMSLVRDIHRDPVKRRLAGLVIELCVDLGIQVIGEGVEVAGERDALVELGCDLLQGYLFGRPGAPFPTPAFAT